MISQDPHPPNVHRGSRIGQSFYETRRPGPESGSAGLARKAAEIASIQAAAEMGFDIRSSSGGISRSKAYRAAKAADDARAGRPVSSQVQRAVSRRDSLLASAFKDAERRGFTIDEFGGTRSRRDAYDDAELAELIRGHILGAVR